MNRSLIFLLLSLPFFMACKREYARVQPAQPDFFLQKQRAKIVKENITPQQVYENVEVKEITGSDDANSLENNKENQQISQFQEPAKRILKTPSFLKKNRTAKVIKHNKTSLAQKVSPSHQLKETPKKQVKKKKRKVQRWGTMIPAGAIFLGIAILLALINLNGLALLFGVASIFFLFLGIRKLLRKKRRRSIFK